LASQGGLVAIKLEGSPTGAELSLGADTQCERTVAAAAKIVRRYKRAPRDLEDRILRGQPLGPFKPSRLLNVLQALSMEPGYSLDYQYHYSHAGGAPSLCAVSSAELDKWGTRSLEAPKGKERESAFDHMRCDGTPNGFFQLAVLHIMGEQFYLYWHAEDNDLLPICGWATLRNLASVVPVEIDASVIDPEPAVEIGETTATVRFFAFSEWGGLFRMRFEFAKQFPHQVGNYHKERVVPYFCGIIF
jgi:hypothetical protein